MKDNNDKQSSRNTWAGRSLTNYKSMHKDLAASKGITKELESAKTLTQARKLLFGYKKSNQR